LPQIRNLFLTAVAAVTLAACGNQTSKQETAKETKPAEHVKVAVVGSAAHEIWDFVAEKDKTEEELWDILGQFAPMKKAVILKLCNDSNYQGFMDSYFQKQKEYFDEDPEDIDNIRYYNASKELKEILDNTKPIYNV